MIWRNDDDNDDDYNDDYNCYCDSGDDHQTNKEGGGRWY